MKILFVLDQLPYPPRNGVTVPTFAYLSRMASSHHVSLLLCNDAEQKLDFSQVEQNKKYVKQFWILERSRVKKLTAVKNEILKGTPYFLGWTWDSERLSDFLTGQTFDVVWGNPNDVAGVIESLKEMLCPNPVFVAAISDCYTALLRNMGRKLFIEGLDFRARILCAVQWARSWLFGRTETKILSKYDLILVQTKADQAWLNTISAGMLNHKVMEFPNGVNETLFQLPVEPSSNNILFLGDLSGEYKAVLLWIIEKVWPAIRSARANARFFIIGKNASNEVRQKIVLDNRIVYKQYLPDILDVFRDKAVMLAPVFKNYGLINKVIESMAAGVPVVGDCGSFNGIPGFEKGHHGIIAEDAPSMARAVLDLLASPQRQFEIARSARALVMNHFSWEDRINTITKKLASLIDNKKV